MRKSLKNGKIINNLNKKVIKKVKMKINVSFEEMKSEKVQKIPKITYKEYKKGGNIVVEFGRIKIENEYIMCALINSLQSSNTYHIIKLAYKSKNKESKKWNNLSILDNENAYNLGEEFITKLKNEEYIKIKQKKNKLYYEKEEVELEKIIFKST